MSKDAAQFLFEVQGRYWYKEYRNFILYPNVKVFWFFKIVFKQNFKYKKYFAENIVFAPSKSTDYFSFCAACIFLSKEANFNSLAKIFRIFFLILESFYTKLKKCLEISISNIENYALQIVQFFQCLHYVHNISIK